MRQSHENDDDDDESQQLELLLQSSLKLEFDTHSYLANTEINVAFFAKVTSPRGPADISRPAAEFSEKRL